MNKQKLRQALNVNRPVSVPTTCMPTVVVTMLNGQLTNPRRLRSQSFLCEISTGDCQRTVNVISAICCRCRYGKPAYAACKEDLWTGRSMYTRTRGSWVTTRFVECGLSRNRAAR
jgi:hypothetical protein